MRTLMDHVARPRKLAFALAATGLSVLVVACSLPRSDNFLSQGDNGRTLFIGNTSSIWVTLPPPWSPPKSSNVAVLTPTPQFIAPRALFLANSTGSATLTATAPLPLPGGWSGHVICASGPRPSPPPGGLGGCWAVWSVLVIVVPNSRVSGGS